MATPGWFSDLINIISTYPSLYESICVLGGNKLRSILEESLKFESLWSKYFPIVKGVVRRIVAIPDKEGKTRMIAILDYLSQSVLRYLHLYLFGVLKKIPQDCTFDQGSFKNKIKDWEILYSVDLSSATDRFPIQIISTLLRGHLPSWYVTAWEDMMVGYPFKGPDNIFVKYKVGNPMGAYSS